MIQAKAYTPRRIHTGKCSPLEAFVRVRRSGTYPWRGSLLCRALPDISPPRPGTASPIRRAFFVGDRRTTPWLSRVLASPAEHPFATAYFSAGLGDPAASSRSCAGED